MDGMYAGFAGAKTGYCHGHEIAPAFHAYKPSMAIMACMPILHRDRDKSLLLHDLHFHHPWRSCHLVEQRRSSCRGAKSGYCHGHEIAPAFHAYKPSMAITENGLLNAEPVNITWKEYWAFSIVLTVGPCWTPVG